MTEQQRIAIWPASVNELVEQRETPFRLLGAKAGWLSRFLWWALQRRGTMEAYMETIRTWTYVPHAQKPLMDAMLEAADEDLPYIYEGRAVFIIGGATLSELTAAPAFAEMMTFKVGPFGIHDPYHGRQMFDIPIHVVPHMVGMALVPRVLVERERRAA